MYCLMGGLCGVGCARLTQDLISKPRLSEIAGIENFQGEVVHPAYWKDDTSVKGKRVALIGYGCARTTGMSPQSKMRLTDGTGSGVQIAPNIIDDVESLLTWFRNKTYVLPPPAQAFSAAGGANFKCTSYALIYSYGGKIFAIASDRHGALTATYPWRTSL